MAAIALLAVATACGGSSSSTSGGTTTTAARAATTTSAATTTTAPAPRELVVEDPNGYRFALRVVDVTVGPRAPSDLPPYDAPPGYTNIDVELEFRNLLTDRNSLDLNTFYFLNGFVFAFPDRHLGGPAGCNTVIERAPLPLTDELAPLAGSCIGLEATLRGQSSFAPPGGRISFKLLVGGIPEELGIRPEDVTVYFRNPQFERLPIPEAAATATYFLLVPGPTATG